VTSLLGNLFLPCSNEVVAVVEKVRKACVAKEVMFSKEFQRSQPKFNEKKIKNLGYFNFSTTAPK